MSDTTPFGFGKLVPGFDFLQNLAKGATGSIPKMPSLSSWVAPTLNVEELDKRVDELKAVQFWLEQNSRALSATIQALEVQKMTLATLKGMNFNMGDVANAFKLKAADSVMGSVQKFSESFADAAHSLTSPAARAPGDDAAGQHDKNKSEPDKKEADTSDSDKSESGKRQANVVDPMQWWGALTQQFQQIATSALADAAKQTAFDPSKGAAATDLAKDAFKAATDMASQMAAKGVQSVQDATRRATSLASAAVTAPILSATPAAAKKTTAARNTTAAKSAAPAAKKTAARKAAPPAPAKKAAAGRGAAKSAR